MDECPIVFTSKYYNTAARLTADFRIIAQFTDQSKFATPNPHLFLKSLLQLPKFSSEMCAATQQRSAAPVADDLVGTNFFAEC